MFKDLNDIVNTKENEENILDDISECISNAKNEDDTDFFLPLNCSEQCENILDNEEFNRGIKEYSYWCGAFTAMVNCGINSSQAMEMIINNETIKHNIEVTKINTDSQIEISKNTSINNSLETI